MFIKRTLYTLGMAGALALSVSGLPTQAATLDIRPHEAAAVCGARAPQVKVIVENVTSQGILTVELYRPSKRDFLKKASRVHRIRVPAKSGSQTVCFDIKAAGAYAVAAYQDLDADRDLDQKWNMMPAEPFALSSNKKLAFAMPVFDDAAFQVPSEGAAIRIRLQR
ncbi:Uncharacterized conserved protein, DUF2141 family [Roseovarius lutimaris]|uniref:Uncharacterized conserved protein, DUF2141 family n=1 Tax=Roseovarius lutimaris TaxID=1005928 RepID=A0A1I4ZDL0_9RHOB|nr:DUF2141 domain-containing protein [Roseovarius lutimaris]SFN48365.1 Uncharacterized conserved protein, DUF2141 family [Roseovarius lutimaris]